MIKVFLTAALLAGPAISFAENKCANVLEALYASVDFPPALLWLSKGTNHEAFADWAAEKSNKIATDFMEKSATYVLLETAKARADFAREHDHDQSELFGHLRLSEPTSKRTQITTLSFLATKPRVASLKPLAEVGDLMVNRLKISSSSKKLLHAAPINHYTTFKGEKLPASIIFRGENALFVKHPSGTRAAEILTDVLSRLETLKKNTEMTETEKKKEFIECMFGYYNAMPFHRGSAAIGKVFFAGIYLAVFKTKIPPLPDMLDVKAMAMDRSEFVADLLRFF